MWTSARKSLQLLLRVSAAESSPSLYPFAQNLYKFKFFLSGPINSEIDLHSPFLELVISVSRDLAFLNFPLKISLVE